MNNTATLGQIQKILSFLNGIPSEQIQKVIESGFFSDVIRNGELDAIAKRTQMDKVRAMWRIILTLTGGKDISITVPHVPLKGAESLDKFQLRCWLGEHGYTDRTIGHVDSGSAKGKLLFEVYIPERICKQCRCCWEHELYGVGINLSDSDLDWMCEDKGNYDIVSLRPDQSKS